VDRHRGGLSVVRRSTDVIAGVRQTTVMYKEYGDQDARLDLLGDENALKRIRLNDDAIAVPVDVARWRRNARRVAHQSYRVAEFDVIGSRDVYGCSTQYAG